MFIAVEGIRKYRYPLIIASIFVIIGLFMWYVRDVRYFLLFFSIGVTDGFVRSLVQNYPKLKQPLRISLMVAIGGGLFFGLSIVSRVNFQFSQIFFDAYEMVVTGALIQLMVARVILPLFAGSAFCSRVCWDGAFFELTNSKVVSKRKPVKRNEYVAWTYLFLVIITAFIVAYNVQVSKDETIRLYWIIGENLYIIIVGTVLTHFFGSRGYCRLICPFLTISGLFSRFSLIKIKPDNSKECINCNKCNKACPMLIDVKECVTNNMAVKSNTCILCERCVSSCPKDILSLRG
jgi:polyferredoxin